MSYLIKLSIIFIVFSIAGCKKDINLVGFKNELWKKDKGGCDGKRRLMLDEFLNIKNNLKGYSADAIATYLGKPDKNILLSRNQKIFYYFLDEGVHCQNLSEQPDADFIAIHFSAMDLSTEISLNLKP